MEALDYASELFYGLFLVFIAAIYFFVVFFLPSHKFTWRLEFCLLSCTKVIIIPLPFLCIHRFSFLSFC